MSQHGTGDLRTVLPILDWLPRYRRGWLRYDLIASATVLTVLVPEGLAYAQMAGLPPETVFYAAPAALIFYALFATSRQVGVAPSSALAAMSAAVVGVLVATGSPEYIALSTALAVVTRLLFTIFGVLRAGFLPAFFSEPAIVGSVFGLALSIAPSQVHKLVGLEPTKGDFVQRVWHFVAHLREVHLWMLLLGATSFASPILPHRISHRIPAALITLA